MTLLSRDAILAADDIPQETVDVPEWGGQVLVRGLTGTQRDAFEGEMAERNGKKLSMNIRNIRARLVSRTLIDEDGDLLFGPADVDALGEKSAAALDRVFDVALRLSGMSPDDVEEMAANFPEGQNDSSTSV